MIKAGTFFFQFRNQTFPLIIALLFVFVPPAALSWENPGLTEARALFGLFLVACGLILRGVVIGYAYIRRGGRNKQVYADDLVKDGLFGVCRNPLYVGNMLVYSGVFLFHGNIYVFVIGFVVFAFIYQSIVHAEESFLSGKFGQAYKDYCSEVPRWGFRLGAFARSTQGMSFNIRRVIAKDYSTMGAALIGLLATEIYRVVAVLVSGGQGRSLGCLIASLVLVLAFTAVISRLKKRGVFDDSVSTS